MMRNRILIALLAAVCGVGQLAGAESKIVEVNSSNDFPLHLKDGYYYRLNDGVSYSAPATWSAIVLESGTAWIELAEGANVTLKGGNAGSNADWMYSAGAGIEVGKDARLIIYGKGTLNATGGNAANGVTGGVGVTLQMLRVPANCGQGAE